MSPFNPRVVLRTDYIKNWQIAFLDSQIATIVPVE